MVQVITRLDVGGAQATILDTCRQFASWADRMTVIAGPETPNGEMQTAVQDTGAALLIVPALVRRIAPLHDVRAVFEIARLLRRIRPDVVHTHSSKGGVVGRLAAWLARVPVIVHTVHGWSFRDGQSMPVRRAYMILERLLARVTSAIVVVARADRDTGLALRIGGPEKYVNIRSGVDVGRFSSQRGRRGEALSLLGLPKDAKVVVTTMRLAPPKDPFTLVRAVGIVAGGVRLVIIGDGPQRRAVEELAESVGVSLLVTGTRADVEHLLPGGDVFVLSSLSEGLPRATVEAAAAGLPVVATDVGGVREFIDDESTGLVVPPSDAPTMAVAISRMLSDRAFAQGCVEAAERRLPEFDASAMAAAIVALYERRTATVCR